MTFLELAAERFSVRKYSDRPVEKEKLDKIFKAAMLAPTAKNLQPQKIYVLQSAEALAKLDALTPCRFGAGIVLMFTYSLDDDWKNPLEAGVHSGAEDVSIVAVHVMMEAQELGLGTCWCNYFPNTKVEKAFGLPEREKSILIMPLGYPAPDAKPLPLHEQSKDVSEVVKYL